MTTEPTQPNSDILLDLVKVKMPFGKYKGTTLCDLPTFYLEWFYREGFPPGKLGMQLATIFEIKTNGLEYLLAPLKKQFKTRGW
ncbi:DUF3820 family protein [Pontibacter qinzhouensis]|uniref:DUF3820 family protein n=1 Tax=Pontibacter qinzhouensis TaxID=2603253 RepID=A0A5C8KA31_9BACT|nr:DUF3820 family protein [Pontibacter qinzhouensis]TXK48066.1 DUF3820 family protein [Pontibacter qinzhouensis]